MDRWLRPEYELVVVRRRFDLVVVVMRRFDLVVVEVRRRMGPLQGKMLTVWGRV